MIQRFKTRRSFAERAALTAWYTLHRSWWAVACIYAVAVVALIAINLGPML